MPVTFEDNAPPKKTGSIVWDDEPASAQVKPDLHPARPLVPGDDGYRPTLNAQGQVASPVIAPSVPQIPKGPLSKAEEWMLGPGIFSSEPSRLKALAEGAGTFVAEPVLGAAQYLPPKYGGEAATNAAKRLEANWQDVSEQYPVFSRFGYYGAPAVAAAVSGLASAPAAIEAAAEQAPGLAARTFSRMKGALLPSAIYGAAQPVTDAAPYSKEFLQEKAINTVVGAVAGPVLSAGFGAAGDAISKGWGAVKSGYNLATGKTAQGALSELAESITSGKLPQELASGKVQATEADLAKLLADRKITTAQFNDAIKSIDAVSDPEIAQLFTRRNAAEAEVGKITEELNSAPAQPVIGGRLKGLVDNFLQTVRGDRRSIADAAYGEWESAAQERFAQGDVWQQSPSGKTFLKSLRDRLDTSRSTKITSEERSLIENRLLPDLEGVTSPGKAPGLREVDGNLHLVEEGEPGQPSFSTPKVIQEVLRKLRDVASGHPAEGYDAIGQQRAGRLADDLAASIKEWEPSLADADNSYREASALFEPFQTQLGRAVSRGEKFDYERLAIDPNDLPAKFFKSPEKIKQLIAVTGGKTQEVQQAAKDYALQEMAHRGNADAMIAWMKSQKDWLNPETTPEAYKAAQNAVVRLKSAEDRVPDFQKIIDDKITARTEAKKEAEAAYKEALKASEKVEQSTKDALAKFQKPLFDLSENVRRGVIKPEDAPKMVREFLRQNVVDIPSDVAVKITQDLEKIEKVQDATHRAKLVAKWAAGLAGLGVAARFEPALVRAAVGGHQ